MLRTRLETAQFVVESIESLGVAVNPTSRLGIMLAVLAKPRQGTARVIVPSDPDFETALESVHDMSLLEFIFDQLNGHECDDDYMSMVRKVVKDSVLPQADRTQSRGRDAQFELYVTAVCQSAGLTPVRMEEPDVTCTFDATRYGIAAKRIKSVAALEKRVREASNQIVKAGLPGIMVLDTCVALNKENRRIEVPIPEAEFGELYRRAVNRFVHEHHDRLLKWTESKGVLGLVVHDLQVRMDPSGGWSSAGMTLSVSMDAERESEFDAFQERYLAGLPNREVLG